MKKPQERMQDMKAYKKNVVIEKKNFKEAYYRLDGELYFISTYTKSWTDKEIIEDVVKTVEEKF